MTTSEQTVPNEYFINQVVANPGAGAKGIGKTAGIHANSASNRLLALVKLGRLFRVKTRTSFLYYATKGLAADGQRALNKSVERNMSARPIGEVSGFGTSELKKKKQAVRAMFSDKKADESKAKITRTAAPPGRYDPGPGFKGEFTREWEERRRA